MVEQQLNQQQVYISGFQHIHSLTVGVAYYYRGHYLYAYPQRNPIEPVPFSTKQKGVRILGLIHDRAPAYDPKDPSLVCESNIRALERSCFHERESREINRRESEEPAHNAFTPHDRGQYLAYSTPGSRVGSVESLRQLSLEAQSNSSLGVPGQGRNQRNTIRTTASISRLHQLLAEEELRSLRGEPYYSAEQEEEGLALELPPPEDYMDLDSISAFIETVSQPSSCPPSRPLSRTQRPLPSQNLPHTRLKEKTASPAVPALASPPLPSPTLHFPLSTIGRPRAASRALNEAYNAANASSSVAPLPNTITKTTATATAVATRCTLHNEPCDGESVTDPHATLRAQMGTDFGLQQVPLIRCVDGRVMVDWVTLRDEEVTRMGGRKD